jgi:hypothetical protein
VGLEIPGELATLLNELGYIWPKSDETQLAELGSQWVALGDTLRGLSEDAAAAMRTAVGDNSGDAITAFQTRWGTERSPATVLAQAATGAPLVGAALYICAMVVLALKINVIVQLTILLIEIIEAIATAPETFGGSLLEIPAFKKLADMAINFLINKAMEAILG